MDDPAEAGGMKVRVLAPWTPSVELIAELGVVQPIVVVSDVDDRYRIAEERRRSKAVQLLAEDTRSPEPPHIDALVLSGCGVEGPGICDGLAATVKDIAVQTGACACRPFNGASGCGACLLCSGMASTGEDRADRLSRGLSCGLSHGPDGPEHQGFTEGSGAIQRPGVAIARPACPPELLVLVRCGEALINLPADDADHVSAAQHAPVNVR
jgi:hypothetical protein